MRPDDAIRLRHMLDAAREALEFARGVDIVALADDRMRLLSIVKCIEIIGEAAAHVSEETRAQTPELPWNDIVAMRNRLIHGYYDIDWERVWDTAMDDLPQLTSILEKVLEIK